MLEKNFLFKRPMYLIVLTILFGLLLASCNMPAKNNSQPTATPTSTAVAFAPINSPAPTSTPTEVPSLCANPYQPSKVGSTWVYNGSDTNTQSYNRTDAITNAGPDAFTIASTLSTVSYNVDYTCTAEGLVANNPVQQYLGALLASPNSPVKVDLLSTTGVSLPKQIKPGDTWEQTAEVNTTLNGTQTNGLVIFDYTAVGFENVTVLAGTYNALRVDATIRIEVTPFRILAGTITTSSWYATDVGVVQTQSTSNVPGVNYTDHTGLLSYTPATR